MILRLLLPILSIISFLHAYNILLAAPGHSSSHLIFYARVANALTSDKSNKVTLLIVQYRPNLTRLDHLLNDNVQEIRTLVIPNSNRSQLLTDLNAGVFKENFDYYGLKSLTGHLYLDVFAEGCENFIQNRSLLTILKKEKFDVAIFHMVAMCEFGLAHLLDIKSTIWMSSGLLYDNQAWIHNIPLPSSHIPHLLSKFDDKMTFLQRLFNFIRYSTFLYTDTTFNNGLQSKAYKKIYGSSFPDLLNEIATKTEWILANHDLFLDFPRPIVDRLTYIAGIGMSESTKKQPLNVQWQEVLDKADHGVVLFSLGSIANTDGMPLEWKTSFLEAFSRLSSFTCIWKLDSPIEDPSLEIPPNVIITRWMPQNDLLASGKVKAFITHGGFNSLMEATVAGVPLIMIPLFWDQFRNARNAADRGVSIMLTKSQVPNRRLVFETLREILYNESYLINAKKYASFFAHSQKFNDRGRLVEHILRYVIRHEHFLNRKSTKLNLFQYFLFDIILSYALLSVLIFCTVVILTKNCFTKYKR